MNFFRVRFGGEYFAPIVINSKGLPVYNSVKILDKRNFFSVILKCANVPCSNIINFYRTTIRPVLEYCAPVFHHALLSYVSEDIKSVQKRIPSIICLQVCYSEFLVRFLQYCTPGRWHHAISFLVPLRKVQATSCQHCYPLRGILGIA